MKYDTKNATNKKFEEARHKDNTANTFAHEVTDNMEHGNHTKYICAVKDDVIVHCYDNLVWNPFMHFCCEIKIVHTVLNI